MARRVLEKRVRSMTESRAPRDIANDSGLERGHSGRLVCRPPCWLGDRFGISFGLTSYWVPQRRRQIGHPREHWAANAKHIFMALSSRPKSFIAATRRGVGGSRLRSALKTVDGKIACRAMARLTNMSYALRGAPVVVFAGWPAPR